MFYGKNANLYSGQEVLSSDINFWATSNIRFLNMSDKKIVQDWLHGKSCAFFEAILGKIGIRYPITVYFRDDEFWIENAMGKVKLVFFSPGNAFSGHRYYGFWLYKNKIEEKWVISRENELVMTCMKEHQNDGGVLETVFSSVVSDEIEAVPGYYFEKNSTKIKISMKGFFKNTEFEMELLKLVNEELLNPFILLVSKYYPTASECTIRLSHGYVNWIVVIKNGYVRSLYTPDFIFEHSETNKYFEFAEDTDGKFILRASSDMTYEQIKATVIERTTAIVDTIVARNF